MNETTKPANDLARITIAILLIVGMIAGSVWILRPFLPAVVWATMIVVATWPVMLRVQSWLRRRSLAVVVMTLALILVIVVPLVAAIAAMAGNADRIMAWVNSLAENGLPPLPDTLRGLPLIGPRLAGIWEQASAPGGLTATLAPYAQKAVHWVVARVGSIGAMAVQFLVTVIVAAILYAKGETAAKGVVHFARRLAGDRGENSARLAAQAIRSVALGVVVTALAQSIAGGIGLAIASVPFVAILTAIMLFLAIAQLGPMPVLVPAVIWLFSRGSTGWAIFLLVWTVIVGSLDNVLRPILIKRGVDLPLLLVISGVIGGLIAFGVIGIFIGPVLLAVTYRLLEAWIEDGAAGPKPRLPQSPPGTQG